MSASDSQSDNLAAAAVRIGLLTGGDDRSYVLGLTAALVAHGVSPERVRVVSYDGAGDQAAPAAPTFCKNPRRSRRA